VQRDPIKPTLKAPGTNILTLNHDEQLSTFAFNFKLRRYIEDDGECPEYEGLAPRAAPAAGAVSGGSSGGSSGGGMTAAAVAAGGGGGGGMGMAAGGMAAGGMGMAAGGMAGGPPGMADMMKDPGMMSKAADMMENMTEEQLESMNNMVPGG